LNAREKSAMVKRTIHVARANLKAEAADGFDAVLQSAVKRHAVGAESRARAKCKGQSIERLRKSQ
jgi:hypothetical protein